MFLKKKESFRWKYQIQILLLIHKNITRNENSTENNYNGIFTKALDKDFLNHNVFRKK